MNSAITALSVNRNNEARQILGALNDYTPVAEYARSLTFARLKENDNFYRHISKACTEVSLRKRAATEPDFYPYREEAAFRSILNEIKEDAQ